MKRILYITDSTEHGGAEEHLKTLAIHFSRRGYDVCVAIPNSKGTENLIHEITGEGVKVDAIRMRPLGLANIDILRNVFYFCQYFLRERPDLIHFVLPWPTMGIWRGMLSARLLGIPYAVDFQLIPPFLKCGIFKRRILSYLFRQAHGLICASKGNRDKLAHFFGLESDRVRVIYNCIDVERFERVDGSRIEAVRNTLGIQPGNVVLTTVARLSEQKGHECLIRAARHPELKNGATLFLLVGDGDLRFYLECLVKESGLSGKCIFLGYRSDIPEILSLTDIFVLPSLYEGLPHALLEAMAAGCCVVASRVDGVHEVVRDGENGVLVDPGDPTALAIVLTRLVKSREQRAKMGEKAREGVKQFFNMDRLLRETLELYDEIL